MRIITLRDVYLPEVPGTNVHHSEARDLIPAGSRGMVHDTDKALGTVYVKFDRYHHSTWVPLAAIEDELKYDARLKQQADYREYRRSGGLFSMDDLAKLRKR